MPIISISINLSLAQNLNLLAGNFLLMEKKRLIYLYLYKEVFIKPYLILKKPPFYRHLEL